MNRRFAGYIRGRHEIDDAADPALRCRVIVESAPGISGFYTAVDNRGRAVVSDSIEHYQSRIADAALDVDETSVLVLKNCGPKGYPGMTEVGNMGLPPKSLARGVSDMVDIYDARMSGTAYGTVVLHVAPESAAGGRSG